MPSLLTWWDWQFLIGQFYLSCLNRFNISYFAMSVFSVQIQFFSQSLVILVLFFTLHFRILLSYSHHIRNIYWISQHSHAYLLKFDIIFASLACQILYQNYCRFWAVRFFIIIMCDILVSLCAYWMPVQQMYTEHWGWDCMYDISVFIIFEVFCVVILFN